METVERDAKNYTGRALDGLVAAGWDVAAVPKSRKLRPNRQLVRLEGLGRPTVLRLSIYKVGLSGRGSAHERRVELTTTYGRKLKPDPSLADLVLGYDPTLDVFVGLDPRRLEHGGKTHNASSFVEASGPAYAQAEGRLVVLDRTTRLFGVEYQAFFSPHLLAEYVVNTLIIHSGAYRGGGPFSGVRPGPAVPIASPTGAFDPEAVVLTAPSLAPPQAVSDAVIERAEATGRPQRKTSPEELEQILRRQAVTGEIGELVVLTNERRRLDAAGRSDLAKAVRHVALDDVSLGYDIHSFETDGTERLVEVKATIGTTRTFEVTANEWRVAARAGKRYVIARVTRARSSSPDIHELRDPVRLLRRGDLTQKPSSYRVSY